MNDTPKGITKREKDYSQWYLDIVRVADLAENSAVRGCMVIKPYGYTLWENIQSILDGKIKETGHTNAYFPLFVPKSFLSKEAAHIEGFAKECAVVTHHRLIDNPDKEEGGVVVDPEAKLDEEVVVRPTSETVIYDTYSRWIQSWRDLPLLINQWANIVRWELRTRPFLRTTEFLWQEGHTAHATEKEAEEEARKMLDVYVELSEKYLAIPAIKGAKPEHDKFPGALRTYTFEAMMQDGKALQSGTSHNLGQNFAKPFGIKFTDKDEREKYVWQTSWGVSTRLIGGVIMSHSDDKGFVAPPRVAPVKAVIIPIWSDDGEKKKVLDVANKIKEDVVKVGDDCASCGAVVVDDRPEMTPGAKFNEWEKKGVPIRIEIGPKDLKNNQAILVRRDTSQKTPTKQPELTDKVPELLDKIQDNLFQQAKERRQKRTCIAKTPEKFKQKIESGHFVWAEWDQTKESAEKIQKETKATIRLVPVEGLTREENLPETTKDKDLVLWAKAY